MMEAPAEDDPRREFTVADIAASVNEGTAVVLVALYSLVAALLAGVVYLLFVPFSGTRFFYGALSVPPHVLLSLWTLIVGLRSLALVTATVIASAAVLVLGVAELVLRTIALGGARLTQLSAVLDVLLWFIALVLAGLALLSTLLAARYLAQLYARRGVQDDETLPSGARSILSAAAYAGSLAVDLGDTRKRK